MKLEPVQPPVAAGVVPKLSDKCELVGAIAVLHDAVQSYIKCIAEDQLIYTYSSHQDNGMTGPVTEPGPVGLLVKELPIDIGLKFSTLRILNQCGRGKDNIASYFKIISTHQVVVTLHLVAIVSRITNL